MLALLWALFTAMLLISAGDPPDGQQHVHAPALVAVAGWHDPLTRLHNRGALFERAKALAGQCQAQSLPFSVVQIDLDNFKSINDRFGHQAGDKVLSHAAGLIASALRKNDVAGRVGGEEFCVVLPGIGLEEARAVAERIRSRIDSKRSGEKEHDVAYQRVDGGQLRAGEGELRLRTTAVDSGCPAVPAKQRGRNRWCGTIRTRSDPALHASPPVLLAACDKPGQGYRRAA